MDRNAEYLKILEKDTINNAQYFQGGPWLIAIFKNLIFITLILADIHLEAHSSGVKSFFQYWWWRLKFSKCLVLLWMTSFPQFIKAHAYWFVIYLNISVYDVTRRETFTNLSDVWAKEIELYSTNSDCVRVLVGNKVDRVRSVMCLLCILAYIRGCIVLWSLCDCEIPLNTT